METEDGEGPRPADLSLLDGRKDRDRRNGSSSALPIAYQLGISYVLRYPGGVSTCARVHSALLRHFNFVVLLPYYIVGTTNHHDYHISRRQDYLLLYGSARRKV